MEKCFHGQDSHSVWIVHAWGTNTYFLVAFTLPYWMAVHIYGIIIKSTQNSKLYWKQQRYPNRNDDVWRLRKKQMCQISEYWNPGCNCVVLKCCFSAQELKRRFRSHKKSILATSRAATTGHISGLFLEEKRSLLHGRYLWTGKMCWARRFADLLHLEHHFCKKKRKMLSLT